MFEWIWRNQQDILNVKGISICGHPVQVLEGKPEAFLPALVETPLFSVRDTVEMSLFMSMKSGLDSLGNRVTERVRFIDGFARVHFGSLFATRFLGAPGSLPLLTPFESKVWHEIVDQYLSGVSEFSVQVPTAPDLLKSIPPTDPASMISFFKAEVQAKREIVSLSEGTVGTIGVLNCSRSRICYLFGFPRTAKGDDVRQCMCLTMATECASCPEVGP